MGRTQGSQRSAASREREEPQASNYALADMPEPKSEADTFKAVVGSRTRHPSARADWVPSPFESLDCPPEVATVAATAASVGRPESICKSDTVSNRRSGMALETKLRFCIMIICFGILCILVGEQVNITVTDADGHLLQTPPPGILDLIICAPAVSALSLLSCALPEHAFDY
ncbi:hypothetical protein GQ53DRAFT_459413 [Thozetella sp. PMI_491]|nr:hypothetical protein GQ53DRAFT_459413 [Thozetella sp. PMI_491]